MSLEGQDVQVDKVDTTLPLTDTVWSVLPVEGFYLSVDTKVRPQDRATCSHCLQLTVICDLVTWVRFVDCAVFLVV